MLTIDQLSVFVSFVNELLSFWDCHLTAYTSSWEYIIDPIMVYDFGFNTLMPINCGLHVVSWVRCGTWLYRFPIFAVFLTSLSQIVVVDGHGLYTALHFDVKAKENQDKGPLLY